MSAHHELRAKVRDALEDHMQTLDEATDAVMKLFAEVGRGSSEVEITAYQDLPNSRRLRSWYLEARCYVGTEEYVVPADRWTELP